MPEASAVEAPDLEIEHAREGDPGGKRNEAPGRDPVQQTESIDGRDDHQPLRDDVQQTRERAVETEEQPRPSRVERKLHKEQC